MGPACLPKDQKKAANINNHVSQFLLLHTKSYHNVFGGLVASVVVFLVRYTPLMCRKYAKNCLRSQALSNTVIDIDNLGLARLVRPLAMQSEFAEKK